MRIILARLVVVAGLVAALVGVSASPARSVEALRFTDPAGDQLDARPSMDIVAVALEVKPMSPRNTVSMVVTIDLSGPPEELLTSYNLDATVPGCGYFTAAYTPGAYSPATQYFMECGAPDSAGTGTSTGVQAFSAAKGNRVEIWTALANFPKEVRESGVIQSIRASTQISDPATGIIGNGVILPSDSATTDKEWKFT